MTLRLLLCDDQNLTRAGLRKLLESRDGLEVVGEVDRPAGLVAAAARLRPDVVITESALSGVPVPGLLAEVLELPGRSPKILVLSSVQDEEVVAAALRAGAAGYALKSQTADELVRAIHAVGDGKAPLAPEVTRPLLRHLATYYREVDSGPACDLLTQRELDVLRLLAEGMSNLEIARLLSLGEATVKSHVSHVLAKLDLRDRVQAAVFAYRSGLVSILSPADRPARKEPDHD